MCSSLKYLTINSKVTIDYKAFDCVNFDTITVNGCIDDVYADDDYSFGMFGKLNKVIIKKNPAFDLQIINAQGLKIDTLIIEKEVETVNLAGVTVNKTYLYDKITVFDIWAEPYQRSSPLTY